MKRIQNKIAESRWSLPITSIIAVLVWLIGGAFDMQMWIPFVCFVLSSYIMVELNTTFVLLRTYSRMISCVFMALSCCSSFLFTATANHCAVLFYIASLMPLFKSYQDRTSAGFTYYAFVALGMASLFWVQMLYFLPLIWLLMTICLRSISSRTFWASVMGAITPYWFCMVYFIFAEDWETPLAHFSGLIDFGPIATCSSFGEYVAQFGTLGTERFICLAFVMTLFVTGFVHFLRTRHLDKLNTRMFYDLLITIVFVTFALIFLLPHQFDMLYHLLMVCASPVIAHYITHTRTRITNISFLAMIAAAVVIIVVNLTI